MFIATRPATVMFQQDVTLSQDDRAMPLYISIRQRAVSLPQHAFIVGLCLQTAVNFLSTRSPVLGSCEQARTLSYSAVKLFSKYSNLCVHGT